MIPMIPMTMDLDAPWGPEEAGDLLDRVPADVVLIAIAATHQAVHDAFGEARAHTRWWRRTRHRELRDRERHYCGETARRRRLVQDIARARAEAGE